MVGKILVIAEHDNNELNLSTLSTVGAAGEIGGETDVLVAGSKCGAVVEQASKIAGIAKVLQCDSAEYANAMAENIANLVISIADPYTHILAPSSTFGKNFLPRVAAKLDVAQVTDVIEIISEDTIKRPIYAGNAIATVQMSDKVKLMSIRTTAFEMAEIGDGSVTIEEVKAIGDFGKARFVKMESSGSGDGTDLTSAKVVISGGRGVGSKDGFKMLEKLAAKFESSAIGASRAAVDAGFVPNDYQIGQTGKIVAPDLYIAVGISGAIQHLAGMKDSGVIVAVNKDENAPIFEVADFGVVGEYEEILEELVGKI